MDGVFRCGKQPPKQAEANPFLLGTVGNLVTVPVDFTDQNVDNLNRHAKSK